MASYLVGVRQFTAFHRPRGRELEEATRADLEAFIAELLTSRSAATASTRYKQLQALYRWLEDEEEIAVNPMARMKPPMVTDKPVPVVPEGMVEHVDVAHCRRLGGAMGGRCPTASASRPSRRSSAMRRASITLDTYGHLFPSEMDTLGDRLELVREAAVARLGRTQHGPADTHLGETAGG